MLGSFIHIRVFVKELLHQARNLVCYKSTRHAHRLGAASMGYQTLSATILDAILNISNSETRTMYVTQESVISAFCMQIP